jgi:hypothetical protein
MARSVEGGRSLFAGVLSPGLGLEPTLIETESLGNSGTLSVPSVIIRTASRLNSGVYLVGMRSSQMRIGYIAIPLSTSFGEIQVTTLQ